MQARRHLQACPYHGMVYTIRWYGIYHGRLLEYAADTSCVSLCASLFASRFVSQHFVSLCLPLSLCLFVSLSLALSPSTSSPNTFSPNTSGRSPQRIRAPPRDARLHIRNVFWESAENAFGMSIDRLKNVSRQMGPKENVFRMSRRHILRLKMSF